MQEENHKEDIFVLVFTMPSSDTFTVEIDERN